jgi:hypothetical protein
VTSASTDASELLGLLEPLPAGLMEALPVGDRVNDVHHDDPSCQEVQEQQGLF